MAFVQLLGEGPYWPPPQLTPTGLNTSKLDTTVHVIDATGEKIAMCGRVWTPNRAAKSIRKIGFRFAGVTKAGGSALTASLQDVSLTTGPPIQPDEVQDQTVAIANANAAFVTDTWILTDALSADRSVVFGELLSVVLEFDGAGRLGADTVTITAWNALGASNAPRQTRISHKTAGAWAMSVDYWPVLFEFSDGTFGGFSGVNFPFSAVNIETLNTGTSPDEYAQRIVPTIPMKVDGAYVEVNAAASADFEVILYGGTTAMTGGTVTIDSNAIDTAAVYRITHVTFAQEVELVAGGVYYLAVKPTTANSVIVPVLDVSAAAHLAVHPGGVEWHAGHRVDAGAWTLVTTRRLFAGLRISSLEYGTLTAAEIRAAVGLASANLDTQITSVQADTNDIQTRIPAALTAGGNINANLVQILGTTLTETAGLIAAGFKKFFNVATPTGTVNSLPDAVPDAAGGLPISDVGGLDLDAKLANTNEVTAARMGALTDWINGGRLDLIIDDILADTVVIGATGAGLTSLATQASINTIDGIVDDILVDTAEIGAAGAGLTAADDAVITAIGALNNITAASVWAAGTRTLTAGTGIVLAKGVGVTGFTDISAAQVNAEVLDVLNVDTFAEPGQEAPAATTTIRKMLQYLFKAWRNKSTETATEYKLYADDATTVDQKSTHSDDATTFISGEIGTGP